MQPPVVCLTTLTVTTVIFCNQIMTKHKKIEIVYLTRWFINQAIQEGFRSFMLCAYEIIEYYYSVAKPYCRKKAITCIVFQKNKKQNLSWNNMVLVTIDSSKGSLPIASWPSNICAAIFLFFSLPYVCYHNSDKFRYPNICISTSSFVSSFQWKFSSVKQRCFHFFFWNDGHREYKFVPVIRCQIQNVVYRLQVIKTNSNVR